MNSGNTPDLRRRRHSRAGQYKIHLIIRTEAGGDLKTFRVHCRPGTLRVVRHPSGNGFSITVDDANGFERAWFATEITSIRMEAVLSR